MGILTNGAHASPGAIGEIITGVECKVLNGLLKLLRPGKHPAWLRGFLDYLALYPPLDRQIGAKDVIGTLLDAVNESAPETHIDALMYLGDNGAMLTVLDEDEHAIMLRYLALQQSGSWLADFMDVECKVFAGQKNRTPEQVIRGLVGNELNDFDCDIETSKRMLKQHPELFTSGDKHYMSHAEFEEAEKYLAAKAAQASPPATPAPAATPPPAPRLQAKETEPTRYQLAEVKDGTFDVADANLSRAEFRALQKHLATMRARKSGKGKAA